jgi:hypothetical protein
MAIIGRIARAAYRMTPARKKALAAARAASAKARSRGVTRAASSTTRRAATTTTARTTRRAATATTTRASRTASRVRSRAAVRAAASPASRRGRQSAAVASVDRMNLTRVSRGTRAAGQKRVSSSNFRGAAGRARRRATYADRLNSSRTKYRSTSIANRVGQKAIGTAVPTGVFRRKYVDLTVGENVRRNVSRNLKVAAAGYAVVGGVVATSPDLRRNLAELYGNPLNAIRGVGNMKPPRR